MVISLDVSVDVIEVMIVSAVVVTDLLLIAVVVVVVDLNFEFIIFVDQPTLKKKKNNNQIINQTNKKVKLKLSCYRDIFNANKRQRVRVRHKK